MADDDTPVEPLDAPAVAAPQMRRNGRPKRISRWDRPPEPHDWRWVVGHIGRLLITVGLLMFGFVAYQLWGTGIQTARAQNQLDSEFSASIEESGSAPATHAPAVTTTTTPPDTTTPDTAVVPDPTTTTAPPATTTTIPVAQDYGDIAPGDVLLELVIPRIDFNWKVVAGVGVGELAQGPGHFPDTPLPGQLGNAAIAGHRTGHGGPFFDLDQLQPGDEIQVYTRLGDAYAYIVTDSLVVTPQDYNVITDSDPQVATLTLITCEPKYTSKQRLVVHATLDPSRGSPVGLPLVYGAAASSELPSDDTAIDTTTVAPTTTVAVTDPTVAGVPATSAVAVAPTVDTATTEAAAVSTVTGVSRNGNASEFAEDAFSQGWFDDDAAWPHVAGWAILLGVVAYGAYRLAKRYRRLYLAFVAGFVPFVVVLYFFYENINRLLPAAI